MNHVASVTILNHANFFVKKYSRDFFLTKHKKSRVNTTNTFDNMNELCTIDEKRNKIIVTVFFPFVWLSNNNKAIASIQHDVNASAIIWLVNHGKDVKSASSENINSLYLKDE
jgi:hypothetical protein